MVMPYIKEDRRESIDKRLDINKAGELNYMFTQLIINYIEKKGESYQTYNDIIGAMECCKLELYRRKVSIYEDKKIKENGDVY